MSTLNKNTSITPTVWYILHTICFMNSCIFTWTITGVIPPASNGRLNPLLLFGLFPSLMAIIIHIYTAHHDRKYKYDILPT